MYVHEGTVHVHKYVFIVITYIQYNIYTLHTYICTYVSMFSLLCIFIHNLLTYVHVYFLYRYTYVMEMELSIDSPITPVDDHSEETESLLKRRKVRSAVVLCTLTLDSSAHGTLKKQFVYSTYIRM